MEADAREITLLDLIHELQEREDYSERELVALITHLLRTGRIRLAGIYHDAPYALG